MYFIVSYDIVDDKRRTKLAKKMCNFGRRVQYSVFECLLTKEQYKEMKKEALKFVDNEKDSLRIYRLCGDCKRRIEAFGANRKRRAAKTPRLLSKIHLTKQPSFCIFVERKVEFKKMF